jgi:hypothetical protein
METANLGVRGNAKNPNPYFFRRKANLLCYLCYLETWQSPCHFCSEKTQLILLKNVSVIGVVGRLWLYEMKKMRREFDSMSV